MIHINDNNTSILKLGSGIDSVKTILINVKDNDIIRDSLDDNVLSAVVKYNKDLKEHKEAYKQKKEEVYNRNEITHAKESQMLDISDIRENCRDVISIGSIVMFIWCILAAVALHLGVENTIIENISAKGINIPMLICFLGFTYIGVSHIAINDVVCTVSMLISFMCLLYSIPFIMVVYPLLYVVLVLGYTIVALIGNINNKKLNKLYNELGEVDEEGKVKAPYYEEYVSNYELEVDGAKYRVINKYEIDTHKELLEIPSQDNNNTQLFECDALTFKRIKNGWFRRPVTLVIRE